MPKNQVTWNVIVVLIVGVVGLLTSQSDRLFGKGEVAGVLRAEVGTLSTEVHRIDEQGCQPSVVVRRELVGIKGKVDRNEEDIDKIEQSIETKFKQIITILEKGH